LEQHLCAINMIVLQYIERGRFLWFKGSKVIIWLT